MKILITGASGYVGARIFYDLRNDFDLTGTYFSNQISNGFVYLDITNKDQVSEVVSGVNPEIIIHIANNPSSRWCEEHPEQAKLINQEGSHYLLNVANKIGAKIIYMSTMGAILPKDLYQNTKAYSEKVFQQTQAGYINLRPSVGIGVSPAKTEANFFNSVVMCYEGKKDPVFDTSLKLQPTHLNHISGVIRKCITDNLWNRTIPISVEESRSRFEIATDILKEFNIKTTATDLKIPPFNSVENIDKELFSMGLPTMSYDEAIKLAIEDIKDMKSFNFK